MVRLTSPCWLLGICSCKCIEPHEIGRPQFLHSLFEASKTCLRTSSTAYALAYSATRSGGRKIALAGCLNIRITRLLVGSTSHMALRIKQFPSPPEVRIRPRTLRSCAKGLLSSARRSHPPNPQSHTTEEGRFYRPLLGLSAIPLSLQD